MKWFYNLKEKYRIMIAVASWIPLILTCLIIDTVTGGEMSGGLAFILLIFLAIGLVFTFLMAHVHDKEKKAEKEKAAKANAKADANKQMDLRNKSGNFKNPDNIIIMKWFYNLQSKYRIMIAVASWVFYYLIIYIFVEVNTVLIILLLAILLLAISCFFTIFAVIVNEKEKKVAKEKAEAETKKQAELREKFGNFENTDEIIVSEVAEFSATPSQIIKLTKNGNDDMQSNISYCKVGDDCLVEFDYDKCLYMCTSDGVDVGYFPEGIIEDMAGRGKFAIKIESITENSNSKYVIKVGIHLPVNSSEKDTVNFPIYTKVRGVTFDGRQEFLRESEEGDALIIKHTPTPEYPDSIAIINKRTGKQLGNVGADLAAELLRKFGNDCSFYGIIQEITGGKDGKKTLGCNLTIEGLE